MKLLRRTIDPSWALITGIAALTALFVAGPVASAAVPADPFVPWWLLAALYLAAETTHTRLPLRFGSHEINLAEVATVVGLFLTTPLGVVAAFVVGVLPVRLWRRSAPVKMAFNLSVGLLEVATAITLTRLVVGPDDFGPLAWVATLLALLVASALSTFAVAAIITLNGGSIDLREIRTTFVPAVAVSESTASLALAAVAFLLDDRRAVVLCILPLVVLYGGYQAFMRERRIRLRVELLARAGQRVREATDVDAAVEGLLSEVCEGMRVDMAELALLGGSGRSTRRDRSGGSETVALDRDELHGLIGILPDGGGSALVGIGAAVGLHHAGELVGVLRVEGRPDPDDRISVDDLRTLTTIGSQVAVELRTAELTRTVEQLEAVRDELSFQADHDPLTGLPNRRVLTTRIDAALRRHSGPESATHLLFVDLDDFKRINDEFGHAAGDDVLTELGSRLRAAVRPGDVPARIGGDEFAVLVGAGTAPAEVRATADRVLAAVGDPVRIAGTRRRITASVGLATARPGSDAAARLMARADVAMYAAKAMGKNRVEAYRSDLPAEPYARVELEQDLLRAIGEETIRVVLQPVVDLDTGSVRTVEALARWTHPERGEIPPAEFVPLAESGGFVSQLGSLVLRQACARAKEWWDAVGDSAPGVSVNVSVIELAQPDFVGRVWGVLRDVGLPPERLTLELVERVFLPHESQVAQRLADLHDLGVRIALDDFGTGYSSLSYLRWLPVDQLKIDRSFVAGVTTPGPDRAVIETVLTLGTSLGIEVVAEGIESRRQLDLLRSLGCDQGQGYVTGGPVEPAELLRQLEGGTV